MGARLALPGWRGFLPALRTLGSHVPKDFRTLPTWLPMHTTCLRTTRATAASLDTQRCQDFPARLCTTASVHSPTKFMPTTRFQFLRGHFKLRSRSNQPWVVRTRYALCKEKWDSGGTSTTNVPLGW